MTIDGLKCNDFTELITEYMEGTLSPESEAACAAHVEACPHCSAYLQQMRQTIRVLGSIIDETVTPEIRQQLMDRFRGWADLTPNPLP
jgi:anti-sigma factor RsiW